jgi:toxin ParE1/3/4
MTWKFHPQASREYLDACQYYAGIEGKLGVAFVRSVEIAIDQIVQHPTAWPVLEEDVRRHLLKRFPYGVHYTIEGDFVLIVSVAHMKRKQGVWRNRLA